MTIVKEKIDSDVFIIHNESMSGIVAGKNSVLTTKEDGTFVNGPLSLSSSPLDIRIGGIFKIHPLNLTGIPSTIITPIPLFSIRPPTGSKGVSSIIKGLIL